MFSMLLIQNFLFHSVPFYLRGFREISYGICSIFLLHSFASYLKNRWHRKYCNQLLAYFGLLFVIVVFTSALSGSTRDVYVYPSFVLVNYVSFCLLFLLSIPTAATLRQFLLFLFMITFFTSVVIGILQYAIGRMIFTPPYFDTTRLATINQYDPNYAVLPLLMCWSLNLYLLFTTNRYRSRVLYFVCLLVTSSAFMLTFSRSGWASAAICSIVFFSFNPKLNIVSFKGISVLLVSVMLITSIVYYLGIDDRFMTDSRLQSDRNVATRYLQWTSAVEVLADSPLIGLGSNDYVSALASVSGEDMTTHNLALQVLLQRGIVGFVFFLALLYKTLSNLLSCYKLSAYHKYFDISLLVAFGLSGFASYIFMCMTISDSIGYYIWFYFSFSFALKHICSTRLISKSSHYFIT